MARSSRPTPPTCRCNPLPQPQPHAAQPLPTPPHRKHTALPASHTILRLILVPCIEYFNPGMSHDWLTGPPQVTWTDGATASGSSGSPLIDVESGKIVGVLTGGFASCASRSGPDYYGRLSAVHTCPLCCHAASIQLCPPACQLAVQQPSCKRPAAASFCWIMGTARCRVMCHSWEEGSNGRRHLKTYIILYQWKICRNVASS